MTDSQTAAVVHPLIDFADRWELDGDCIRCRQCGRAQQTSWMHHDFAHAHYCVSAKAERNPWKSLYGLINTQMMKAKVP